VTTVTRCIFPAGYDAVPPTGARLSFDYSLEPGSDTAGSAQWVGVAKDNITNGGGDYWNIFRDDDHVMFTDVESGLDCKSKHHIVPGKTEPEAKKRTPLVLEKASLDIGSSHAVAREEHQDGRPSTTRSASGPSATLPPEVDSESFHVVTCGPYPKGVLPDDAAYKQIGVVSFSILSNNNET